MKKFLPYIFTPIILLGIFIPTHFVHAGWLDFVGADSLVTDVAGVVGNGILVVMSWLLWLSGQLLNFVLKYTIIDLAKNIKDLTGINIAWKVIRDIMNMAFIFLLVYEAIKIIIAQSSTANVKKLIIGIVLASVLINFSLFFTKLLIDASNIVTIGFYNSILGPVAKAPDPSLLGTDYGLSNPIMRSLGLTSLYSSDAPAKFGAGADLGGLIVTFVGSAIIILIASFIFFAVSIMFIIRYIALIILLMLSPVGYMGMALPSMKSSAGQWWSALQSQLLFAPLYMIMTWVVLTLMASPGFITAGKFSDLLSNASKPAPSTIGLIFNFALIIGLLIATLWVAKSTATKGASMIGKATDKLTSFAGGKVFGATSSMGRQTVGRAGNAIANSEYLKNKIETGNFATRNLAKWTMGRGEKVAKSSFDVRSTGGFGAIADATGVKMGKGADAKKVNFQKDLEAKTKAEGDFAKKLKPTDASVDKEIAKSGVNEKKERAQSYLKESEKNLEENNKKSQIRLDEIAEERETGNLTANKADELDREERKINERMYKETEANQRFQATAEQSIQQARETEERIKKEAKEKFANRVDAYAKTFENDALSRWTKNILKIAGGAVVGAKTGGTIYTAIAGGAVGSQLPLGNTKGDNRAIARAIRKASKEKTPDEKVIDALKEKADKEKAERKAAGLPDLDDDGNERPREESEKKPEGGDGTTT